MKITEVPTNYNQICLVSAVPNADNTGDVIFPNGPSGSNEVTKSDVSTVRGASRRVVLRIGAYGAQHIYDTRAKVTALRDAIKRISDDLGAIDGIELDMFRATGTVVAEIVWLAGQLRSSTFFNTNFTVAVVSHPNITGLGQYAKLVADALNTAGHLAYVGLQFYDLATWADPAQVKTYAAPWITAYTASKVMFHLGANGPAGESLTTANSVTVINDLRNAGTTLRGAAGETADTDKAGGWTFGTDVGAAIRQTAPITVAPVASFNVSSTTALTNVAVQMTNTSTGTPTPTYQWDKENDGTYDSTTVNPQFQWGTAGDKVIRLRATGAGGVYSETTRTVRVSAPTNPPPAGGVTFVNGARIVPQKARSVGVYANIYGPGGSGKQITQYPASAYDTIYIFQIDSSGGGSYLISNGYMGNIGGITTSDRATARTAARAAMQTCVDRGQRIMLTIGGSGAGYSFTTPQEVTNCVNSIKEMVEVDFPNLISGVDFNFFEVDARGSIVSVAVDIPRQLKDRYGQGFHITADPASSNESHVQAFDHPFCCAMVNAGVVDHVQPQFYDYFDLWKPSFMVSQFNNWVDILRRSYPGGPYVRTAAQAAAFLGMGVGSGNYGTGGEGQGGGPIDDGPVPVGSKTPITTNKNTHPNMRGVVIWAGDTERGTNAQNTGSRNGGVAWPSGQGAHPQWYAGTTFSNLLK